MGLLLHLAGGWREAASSWLAPTGPRKCAAGARPRPRPKCCGSCSASTATSGLISGKRTDVGGEQLRERAARRRAEPAGRWISGPPFTRGQAATRSSPWSCCGRCMSPASSVSDDGWSLDGGRGSGLGSAAGPGDRCYRGAARSVGPEARDLLAVASVEGETFTVEVLAEVQGLEPTGDAALTSANWPRHRLVREAEAVGATGRRWRAMPSVTRSSRLTSTRSSARAERRLLHGEIAQSLETLYGDRERRHCCRNWRTTTPRPKIGRRRSSGRRRAGDQARAAYANAEAIGWYERTLATDRRARRRPASLAWRLQALSGLGKVCYHTGEMDEAEAHFREAVALGKRLQVDPQELALLMHWLGRGLAGRRSMGRDVRLGEEGLAMLGDDTESLGAALMNQLVACRMRIDVLVSERSVG